MYKRVFNRFHDHLHVPALGDTSELVKDKGHPVCVRSCPTYGGRSGAFLWDIPEPTPLMLRCQAVLSARLRPARHGLYVFGIFGRPRCSNWSRDSTRFLRLDGAVHQMVTFARETRTETKRLQRGVRFRTSRRVRRLPDL